MSATYETGPLSGLTAEQAQPVIERAQAAGVPNPIIGNPERYNRWVEAILNARRDLGIARRGRPPKPRA